MKRALISVTNKDGVTEIKALFICNLNEKS